MYVIGNRRQADDYWSNEFGWVSVDQADRFTPFQQQALNLPDEGYWVPLWSVDAIQFARLITECDGQGIFENAGMQLVADSMDLTVEQVRSIIDRAQTRWDEEVSKIRTR